MLFCFNESHNRLDIDNWFVNSFGEFIVSLFISTEIWESRGFNKILISIRKLEIVSAKTMFFAFIMDNDLLREAIKYTIWFSRS